MKKIILTLICVSLLSGCGKYSDEDINQIIKNGNIIVKALEDYKNDINHYPEELEVLVPKYLEKIPKPGIEKEAFFYTKIPQHLADDYSYGFELFVYDVRKFVMIGSDEINRVVYYPSEKYPQRRFEETHKIIDGWAYQTVYRNYGKKNIIIKKGAY